MHVIAQGWEFRGLVALGFYQPRKHFWGYCHSKQQAQRIAGLLVSVTVVDSQQTEMQIMDGIQA